MRSYEFTEAQNSQLTFVIGDSHAKALGGANNLAQNGAGLSSIFQQARYVPAGSKVVFSGGHSDVVKGLKPQQISSLIAALIDSMEARDIEVDYMLFPKGKKNGDNQDQMAPTRDSIKQRVKPAFDLEGSLGSDGQHATMNTYQSIAKKIAPKVSKTPKMAEPQDTRQKPNISMSGDDMAVLTIGPPYKNRKAVGNMQAMLLKLGYSVGSTGQDGKYGPRTAQSVKAFKQDYQLPGDEFGMSKKDLATLKQAVSGQGMKVQKRTQVSQLSGDIADVAQDSVSKGKVGAVLDLIAGPESGGRYDAVYPGKRRPQILGMNLQDLEQDMRMRGRRFGSSASGRYQYIRKTLAGLVDQMNLSPKKDTFDPATQDKIAIYHLRSQHGLDRWLRGAMSDEEFLKKLSRTWAGLPDPKSGKSFYSGDGMNKAGVKVASTLDALSDIKGLA